MSLHDANFLHDQLTTVFLVSAGFDVSRLISVIILMLIIFCLYIHLNFSFLTEVFEMLFHFEQDQLKGLISHAGDFCKASKLLFRRLYSPAEYEGRSPKRLRNQPLKTSLNFDSYMVKLTIINTLVSYHVFVNIFHAGVIANTKVGC